MIRAQVETYIRLRPIFHTKRRFHLYCNFCSAKRPWWPSPSTWSHGWAWEGQKLEDGGNTGCHLSFKTPSYFSHQKEVSSLLQFLQCKKAMVAISQTSNLFIRMPVCSTSAAMLFVESLPQGSLGPSGELQ